MERVTGIGGVFLKAKDPKALASWYQENLGVGFEGNTWISFSWLNQNNPDVPGQTVFSFFKQDSKYFAPSQSSFMINFRVKELVSLVQALKDKAVRVEGEIMEEENGKFAWIMDPEDNKIELWEPID
jgi:hypothetical protein